mgnify:CR=1 FL=1
MPSERLVGPVEFQAARRIRQLIFRPAVVRLQLHAACLGPCARPIGRTPRPRQGCVAEPASDSRPLLAVYPQSGVSQPPGELVLGKCVDGKAQRRYEEADRQNRNAGFSIVGTPFQELRRRHRPTRCGDVKQVDPPTWSAS